MKTNPASLVGMRFGKLLALEVSGKTHGKTTITCQCDCGAQTTATVGHLVGGRRLSCGCAKNGNPKHGMRYSREYSIWTDMHKRCSNPKSISYLWYGAKGVTVCERWAEFQNFIDDMGACPEGMSIDRVDGSLGYSPDNCRWATAQEQVENRAVQKLYSLNGETMTLPNWCKKLGINYSTMRNRLNRSHMTFEEAVNFSTQKSYRAVGNYGGFDSVQQAGYKE